MGHKDIKRTLFRQVENEYNIDLNNIEKKVVERGSTTLLGSKHLKNLSYNEGKAVYLTESLQQHIDDKRKQESCAITKMTARCALYK